MTDKFQATENFDIGYREYSRVIYGRFTPRRMGIVMDYVNRFNSEMGGRGGCHHDHDCCGCMTGASMSFEVIHGMDDRYRLEIKKQLSYNY